MNLRAFFGWLALSFVAAPCALAASAEERLAKDYLEAALKGSAERLLDFYHPDEITGLRSRVLKVLESEASTGGSAVRGRVFGVATSMEEARRMTPANLYLQLTAKTGLPTERVEKIEPLGTVTENAQTAHVLLRLTPSATSAERSRVAVVSLLKHGKGWRVALPSGFQRQVDQLLSPTEEEKKADSTPPAANTSEIESLLDAAIAALSTGKCATYFNEHMSPRFRSNTSPQALQRLIVDCERSVDSRETYIAALEIARRSSPRYESGGARAIYDMTGKGLPFQRFVLEKIGRNWFVAE